MIEIEDIGLCRPEFVSPVAEHRSFAFEPFGRPVIKRYYETTESMAIITSQKPHKIFHWFKFGGDY
jgi:hypothetical protein